MTNQNVIPLPLLQGKRKGVALMDMIFNYSVELSNISFDPLDLALLIALLKKSNHSDDDKKES